MLRLVASGALIAFLAAPAPAAASEEDAVALLNDCRSEIGASGQICDCLLRQFAKLTSGQQALIRAILTDEATAIAGLHADLTEAEATQAEGFMARETALPSERLSRFPPTARARPWPVRWRRSGTA